MTTTEQQFLAKRRRTRTIAILAAVVLAITIAAGVLVGHAAGARSDTDRQPFRPENSTQQSAYDTSYAETRRQLSEGGNPESVSRGCQLAAYRVETEQGDDQAAGMLGGCADALGEG